MMSEFPDRVIVTETVLTTVLPGVAAKILDAVGLFACGCEPMIMDVTPWILELSHNVGETERLTGCLDKEFPSLGSTLSEFIRSMVSDGRSGQCLTPARCCYSTRDAPDESGRTRIMNHDLSAVPPGLLAASISAFLLKRVVFEMMMFSDIGPTTCRPSGGWHPPPSRHLL